MENYFFGNPEAKRVLIQPVDEHDLEALENEVHMIKTLTDADFYLIAVKVKSWFTDLSPWKAPAVFGNEDFGDGAGDMLKALLPLCSDREKSYYIGGYSLAGLFSLWAAYQTDVFTAVAAASPSVWFPGFTEFMEKSSIHATAVYLSLGDRESRARNPVMASVGDKIERARQILADKGVRTILEWNQGNHFKESDLRTARAFAWILDNT